MRLIDADAFDERVRVAGGMSEEELTEDLFLQMHMGGKGTVELDEQYFDLYEVIE